MERLTYYNPLLGQNGPEVDYAEGGPLLPPTDAIPYNLVSSIGDDGFHHPALDIDIPMLVVPSSTEGHQHVYFDTLNLTWGQYAALLTALADAGILDRAYVAFSLKRGQTLLRPPHVKKVTK